MAATASSSAAPALSLRLPPPLSLSLLLCSPCPLSRCGRQGGVWRRERRHPDLEQEAAPARSEWREEKDEGDDGGVGGPVAAEEDVMRWR
jgi:hypothetical protein